MNILRNREVLIRKRKCNWIKACSRYCFNIWISCQNYFCGELFGVGSNLYSQIIHFQADFKPLATGQQLCSPKKCSFPSFRLCLNCKFEKFKGIEYGFTQTTMLVTFFYPPYHRKWLSRFKEELLGKSNVCNIEGYLNIGLNVKGKRNDMSPLFFPLQEWLTKRKYITILKKLQESVCSCNSYGLVFTKTLYICLKGVCKSE